MPRADGRQQEGTLMEEYRLVHVGPDHACHELNELAKEGWVFISWMPGGDRTVALLGRVDEAATAEKMTKRLDATAGYLFELLKQYGQELGIVPSSSSPTERPPSMEDILQPPNGAQPAPHAAESTGPPVEIA